ncbi:MAG: UDP-2,4-diacetamido-2,4,6-trideoxy-beta-L-altropyranose hydrolase [Candidatus Pristimantibacillus sp.]
MNIYFRLDASNEIGTGHLIRCLTLAEELIASGANITFICKEIPDAMVPLVYDKKVAIVRLATENRESEPTEIISLLEGQEKSVDWFIVDHYEWNQSLEVQLRPHVQRIGVIDDLANRNHDCDLLLDQNLSAMDNCERYRVILPNEAILLLGLEYALLRRDFSIIRRENKRYEHTISRVLICFGGSDPTGETIKALAAINDPLFSNIEFDCIVGRANNNLDSIEQLCTQMKNISLHIQTDQMAALMYQADLAICSLGTITWERYCLGLPAITISVADNQLLNAASIQKLEIDEYLGPAQSVSSSLLREAISNQIKYADQLPVKREKAMKYVDGDGVRRVANALLSMSGE